jgi:AcrR family transcriptional regulator
MRIHHHAHTPERIKGGLTRLIGGWPSPLACRRLDPPASQLSRYYTHAGRLIAHLDRCRSISEVSVVVASSKERIAHCALQLIERDGIVGMRIADVAVAAEVSIPLIYKYFRDRDGLLADVLSTTITNNFLADVNRIRDFAASAKDPITAKSIVAMMPMPHDPVRKRNRRLRVMAIAASYDIPALAEALAASQLLVERATTELLESIRLRTKCTSPISPKAVVLLVQALGLGIVVADTTPETAPSDAEYAALLVDIVERHVLGNN